MEEELLLPNSQYIDTNLGLKYLNANKKLYVKILNSFLTRYENFDITKIKENELHSEMHTLKGLASTLGMDSLSNLSKNLQKQVNEKLILEFSKTLRAIISDLNESQRKTLLIIDDVNDNIDTLINILGDNHDIMVTTTENEVIESINTERIDFALLGESLNSSYIKENLVKKNISIIYFSKPIDKNSLLIAIKSIQK
jgi:HPt (histidine-containing phosphotransfer) domain-containing protein